MTHPARDATEIVVDVDVPLVRMIREFDAAATKVFRAHTDAELFVRWNGPSGAQMRLDHYDCRSGGSYRYAITASGFGVECYGSFHEIRAAELIVLTFTFDGMPDVVVLERLAFEDLANDRSRLTATSLVESFAKRDALIASGWESGVRESYARVDELLAETSSRAD